MAVMAVMAVTAVMAAPATDPGLAPAHLAGAHATPEGLWIGC